MTAVGGLEVVAALGAALVLMSILADRTHLPLPVLLLAGGVVLGTIPVLRNTPLPPEIVLVLFLPALLYWESLSISLREIRRNVGAILVNGVLLVALTAGAVAVVAHALGLAWAAAFVLGAAVAPTDATAVASVAQRLPRRQQTVLRAESLINDGAALVIYAVAVKIATGRGDPGGVQVTVDVALAYGVGAGVGLAVAFAAWQLRKVARNPLTVNVLSVLIPFAAYLPSELLRGSGVIAVVVAGVTVGQVAPHSITALTRLQGFAFWDIATFILNGTLFLLLGLEAYSVGNGLNAHDFGTAVRNAVIVMAVVIGVRLASAYTVVYVIRALDRRPVSRQMRISARQRLATAWAGPRGAISLAAALAVPQTMANGSRFAERDVIVFTTFVVIVGTLVLQSLTLGRVVQWARLPEDTARQDETEFAEKRMSDAADAAFDAEAGRLQSSPGVADRVRRLDVDAKRDDDQQFRDLRLALLKVKRNELVRLRDKREIDDIVLRRLLLRLDREESWLRPDPD